MKIISLDYKNADNNTRSEFVKHFKKVNDTSDFINAFRSKAPNVNGMIVLSTCNRFELIYSEEDYSSYASSTGREAGILCQTVGIEEKLYPSLFKIYEDDNAINHLLRVESGIESMVLGEDEIFRQTKEAYQSSLAGGFSSKELNIIFQKSFEAVKAVKTKTGISKVPVSIGTLVTNLLYDEFKPAKDASDVKVLVIGASGKMGGIVIRDLISKGFCNVYGCIRNHHSERSYWKEYPDEMIPIDYSERYELLNDMDAVISATSCPHFTLQYEEVRKSLLDDKKRLFIDLAIPRDFGDELSTISQVKLLNIDDFNKLSEELNNKKKDIAESLVEELECWTGKIESVVNKR